MSAPDPEPAAIGLDLMGRPLPPADRAPNAPLGHVAPRRAGSVRRTMSIDVDWPEGEGPHARFRGRARDVLTPPDGGAPVMLAQDAINGHFADRRTIADVESVPPRADVTALAGERAGSNLRAAIDSRLRADRLAGAPLYLLLDDLAGASLVCMWAWARWHPNWMQSEEETIDYAATMAGVCIGFRPGSSALTRKAGVMPNHAHVLPLPNPADPEGWHAFPEVVPGAHFRRARLIDIWRDRGTIYVESVFQDSANAPGAERREAIHEYRLAVTADAATGQLLTLDATPGTLPHPECPAAMANTPVLLDTPMDGLREAVLDRLKRTAGCTHLNDMIRSLAEAPILARHLPDRNQMR